MLFWIVLFSILSSLVCAIISAQKDRDEANWFWIGLLLGVFGVVLILFLPPIPDGRKGKYKECNDCAEMIIYKANVCKYCGYRFPENNIDNAS